MTVNQNEYLTYEEQLTGLQKISGFLLPPMTSGAGAFFKSFSKWLTQSDNGNSGNWTVVLPNPSLNLSLPYARDEISLALAVAREYQPDNHEIAAHAEKYSLTPELLDQPVTTLSGGERMLLSLCKASALSEFTKNLCLCSPFFWLDVNNHAAVDRILSEQSGTARNAHLLFLEGEEEPQTTTTVQEPAVESTVTWGLRLKEPTVYFPSESFPRETSGKTIAFSAEVSTLELKSPTLICGPNGTGKTTLAKILGGMVKLQSGEARAVTTGLTGNARLLLQDTLTQLFSQSVKEHLERVFSFDKERRKEAKKLFRQMEDGCAAKLSVSKPGVVIGDREWPSTVLQCKLALTVERLMSETPLLILDEPGWCLSRPVARAFVETVVEVASEKKIAVAVISHQKGWWAGIINDTISLTPEPHSNRVLLNQL